jgi:hypothetical protein
MFCWFFQLRTVLQSLGNTPLVLACRLRLFRFMDASAGGDPLLLLSRFVRNAHKGALERNLNLKARTGVFRGAKPDNVTLEREERGNDQVFENRGTGEGNIERPAMAFDRGS